jgi:hypothetical protein
VVRVGTFNEKELGFFSNRKPDCKMSEKPSLLLFFVRKGNSRKWKDGTAARGHLGCYRRATSEEA